MDLIGTSRGRSATDPPRTSNTLLPITRIPVEEVIYRGEGNANLVVALPAERNVIRFRKSLPGEVPPDGGRGRAEREQEFARNLRACFFANYLYVPEILRCDATDIAKLLEAIRPFRPEKRQQKEIREVYATRLPDYTFLQGKPAPEDVCDTSTFSVEIKPKQGFLRSEEVLLPKCPYCLTQYYKLKSGVIASRSTYCPLDLFSGKQDRMIAAVKGLLASPQNNFKLFKDGKVVYDQESSPGQFEPILAEWFKSCGPSSKDGYVDKFCELIATTLLGPFAYEKIKFTDSLRAHKFSVFRENPAADACQHSELVMKAKRLLSSTGEKCNMEAESLPKNSVLNRVLLMQRVPFESTRYVYATYEKYSDILSDDLVYACWVNPQEPNQCQKQGNKKLRMHLRNPTNEKSHGYTLMTGRSNIGNDKNVNGEVDSELGCSLNEVGTERRAAKLERTSDAGQRNRDNTSTVTRIIAQRTNSAEPCLEEETFTCLHSPEDITVFRNYLLFSSARDCSILMAFRELYPHSGVRIPRKNIIETSDGLSFLCHIGVSDLDPKTIHCIRKHKKRDKDVLSTVISLLEDECPKL